MFVMKVNDLAYRSIWLNEDGHSVDIIDQTLLPHEFVVKSLINVAEAAEAITVMRVRGAPLIGATAAYGIALAMYADTSGDALHKAQSELLATRPTASNLRWALDRMIAALTGVPESHRLKLAYQ
jgi:methylthioribose-1-phosphate isomerase